MQWRIGEHILDLSNRAQIMGIVNATPDSFSDGGLYHQTDDAFDHALALAEEGAGILDIGGESTRPGAEEVSIDAEIKRVIPLIQRLKDKALEQFISIDTRKPEVARQAVAAGATIINDVSGFVDPKMRELATQSQVGLIAMHMQGTPDNMQDRPAYDCVYDSVLSFLSRQLESLIAEGVSEERIILDPGVGFGKTLDHNLELIARAGELQCALGRPILLGVSRKSLFATLLGDTDMNRRVLPTAAVTSLAREAGVMLHRVHDVEANLQALRMTEAIQEHTRSSAV